MDQLVKRALIREYVRRRWGETLNKKNNSIIDDITEFAFLIQNTSLIQNIGLLYGTF